MQCCFTFILFSEKIGDFSVPLLSFHSNFASKVLLAFKKSDKNHFWYIYRNITRQS